MSSPQLENGYTQIANEIIEALYRSSFNGTQFKIIQFVMRFTYGYKKKSAELSETFISKGINVHKITVAKELKKLIAQNVITIISKPSFSTPQVLSINKDYDKWGLDSLQLVNQLTVNKTTNTTVSQSANTTVSQLANQRNKTINKTINKTYMFKFVSFWNVYPKKQNKSASEKAFMKIKPNDELFNTMLSALENQIQSDNWKKDNGKYIPMPSTWLNGKRWEDEEVNQTISQNIQSEYTPEQLKHIEELKNQ